MLYSIVSFSWAQRKPASEGCTTNRGAASRARTSPNPFQRRRFASQTKPLQECHPERSEGSLAEQRSFAPLRMTKPDGLFFDRRVGLQSPPHHALSSLVWRSSRAI